MSLWQSSRNRKDNVRRPPSAEAAALTSATRETNSNSNGEGEQVCEVSGMNSYAAALPSSNELRTDGDNHNLKDTHAAHQSRDSRPGAFAISSSRTQRNEDHDDEEETEISPTSQSSTRNSTSVTTRQENSSETTLVRAELARELEQVVAVPMQNPQEVSQQTAQQRTAENKFSRQAILGFYVFALVAAVIVAVILAVLLNDNGPTVDPLPGNTLAPPPVPIVTSEPTLLPTPSFQYTEQDASNATLMQRIPQTVGPSCGLFGTYLKYVCKVQQHSVY